MIEVRIVCSDPGHPVNAHLAEWAAREQSRANTTIHRDAGDVGSGDFLFLVACQQIVPPTVRERFRHALVLHASDLPRGRGMSPLIWQILEGAERIQMTLLDAADPVDSGDIWHQVELRFDGTEVLDEINQRRFAAETGLMSWALSNCDNSKPRRQEGTPTHYRRRTPEDSRLDPERPLSEAFDLLRVADPDRYPAFFDHRGRRYRLRLDKIREP